MKTRILFVCLGNICRSPLAEALLNYKIAAKGLSHQFEIDSAGTANYHVGEQPDSRTVHNARQHGIKIVHKGRQFHQSDFGKFDHILVMDHQNLQNVQRLAHSEADRKKVQLLRDFDSEYPGSEVPDPWFGGEEGFETVYGILDRCTANLLEQLK